MRKILSFLMMALFSVSLFAIDPVKSVFTKATAPADDKVTDLAGVVTWDIATEVGDNSGGDPTYGTGKSNSIECLKFGNKGTQYFKKATFSTDYFEDYNVTSVKLYVVNNAKKTGTFTAKQGSVTIGSEEKEIDNKTWTELTADENKGAGGTLSVSYELAQAFYISYIEVTYEEAGQGGGQSEEPTTKTLYCKVAHDWWKADKAAVGIYAFKGAGEADEDKNAAWPGVRMTAVDGETDVWTADIDPKFEKVIFVRVNGSGDIANWGAQTADLVLADAGENDLYTITSESAQWAGEGNKVTGEWSKFEASQGGDDPEQPEQPAEKDSIFFVNVPGWENLRVHLWGGSATGTEWPGVEMTLLEGDDEKINDFDVYKYVADKGAYAKCIFSNNSADQTADLDWTSGKYFYDGKWYAKADIPEPIPAAVPLEGNIWKVTSETPVRAGSHFVDEDLIKVDGVFATALAGNARTIDGEEFANAIKVRNAAYPTAEVVTGTEQSGNTSLVITAKEKIDVTLYYNRQSPNSDGEGEENDGKDLKVFDQAAPTTALTGKFKIHEASTDNKYINVTKVVTLEKDHVYTLSSKGTTIQFHGIKFEAHVPAMQIAGAWDVTEDENPSWVVNNMTLANDKLTATYEVELAKGDYEFKVLKDGAWLTKENEGAFGLHRDFPGVAGVKDDAQNNLKVTADAAGTYTFTWTFANDSIGISFPDPEPVAKFYITGNDALVGAEKAWQADAVASMEDSYTFVGLKANTQYYLKVVTTEAWLGYEDLTVKADGLSAGENDNILFKLDEDGDVTVTYKKVEDEVTFKLEGNFHVQQYKDLYLVPNQWADDDAKIAAWVWNKDYSLNVFSDFFEPIAEDNDTLSAKINVEADSIIFVRFNATAEVPMWNGGEGYQWNQTPNDSIQWEKGIFTILPGTEYFSKGTWEVYVPEVPAKFYITGNAALVGDELAWQPNAIRSDEVSYKLNLKADVDYMLKITVNGTWVGENNVLGYDEMTTKKDGLYRGDGQNDNNICFKLNSDGEVSVHYDGEYFFLSGDFYVAPAPEVKYFLKNNWMGGEWTWQEMTKNEETGYYELANVVFGGEGVNFNTAAIDEGAKWIAAEDIEALDMTTYESATLQALDIVAFVFDPSEVNSYTGAHGLSAYILGKFTPEPAAKFYITGNAALVGDELAWQPNAIRSDEVSYKLNLKADVDYMLKITVNGTWEGENNVLGYDEMTTKKDGLYRGDGQNDNNICFKLNSDGEVSVHYDGEYFFLSGDFYVAPAPEVKYYMKNNWGGGEDWTWLEMAKDEDGVYFLSEVVFGGTGVNINTSASEDGATFVAAEDIAAFDAYTYEDVTLSALDIIYISFDPNEVSALTGENGLMAAVLGKQTPVEPEIPDGFYLVSSLTQWAPNKEYLFKANEENPGEYVLSTTLTAGDEIKVVLVENEEILVWYPGGDNYVVDEAHAGAQNIYFKPEFTEAWAEFGGYFFIEKNTGTGLDNIAIDGKAVKAMIDGQLFIIRSGKTYTIQGMMVK